MWASKYLYQAVSNGVECDVERGCSFQAGERCSVSKKQVDTKSLPNHQGTLVDFADTTLVLGRHEQHDGLRDGHVEASVRTRSVAAT